MHEFHLEPHAGFGPVRLGDSREEVRKALSSLGFPLENSHGSLDYFCEAAIQTEIDSQQRVHFIGLSCHKTYSVIYRGVNVFDTPAEDIFEVIASHDGSGDHTFNESEYCFPNQIVTLWEADSQYDRLGSEQRVVWAQIGLGNQRYLDAVRTPLMRHG